MQPTPPPFNPAHISAYQQLCKSAPIIFSFSMRRGLGRTLDDHSTFYAALHLVRNADCLDIAFLGDLLHSLPTLNLAPSITNVDALASQSDICSVCGGRAPCEEI